MARKHGSGTHKVQGKQEDQEKREQRLMERWAGYQAPT